MSRRRRFERTSAVLLGCLAAVLLLEAGLQLAAVVVQRRALAQHPGGRLVPKADTDTRTVVCLGDSYTFGVGGRTPDEAYPEQLERLLNESSRSTTWRVVNRGWPGRNSSELLQRTPGILSRDDPDYVVVLIGTNDRWSRTEMDLPAPSLESSAAGAPTAPVGSGELRTIRLARILWAGLSTGWNGTVADTATDEPLSAAETTGEHGSGDGEPAPYSSTLVRGDASMAAYLERLRLAPRDGPHLRATLDALNVLVKTNRDAIDLAAVNRLVDDLRPAVRASGDRESADLVVKVLSRLHRFQAVIEEATYRVERYGSSPEACERLVVPLARLGRYDEALYWADEALRLQGEGAELASIYRARAYVYRKLRRYPDYVRDWVRAFSLDSDEEELAEHLRKVAAARRPLLEQELRDESITASLSLRPEVRARAHLIVRQVLRETTPEPKGSDWLRKLEEDLRLTVALARAYGAQPVVLTYPGTSATRDLAKLQREVARETGVPLVDVGASFDERLARGSAREAFFIADGHCNGAGYGLMAELVADALRSLDAETGSGATASRSEPEL